MNDMIYKGIWVVSAIIMIIYYARRKHTVRSALSGMLSGGAALILLHYFGDNLGYAPPVNLFNTAVSLVLGVPGAALIMAVNLI
ncbi:MAG: pro-sigmaK processing inhibitor BofA family protein [Oscillospiraceae bacterium]|nr:pro-sigmaK processing inhibitor BofA family protein [Oscillospiraceae bacterium]